MYIAQQPAAAGRLIENLSMLANRSNRRGTLAAVKTMTARAAPPMPARAAPGARRRRRAHNVDFEAIIGRRVEGDIGPSRCNTVIDQQSRPQTMPIPAATRNLPRTMQLRVRPSHGQRSLHPNRTPITQSKGERKRHCPFRLKVARDCPALPGVRKVGPDSH